MQKQPTKNQIRTQIRAERQELSPLFQMLSAEQCKQSIINSNILKNNKNIAFYISNDNELSLQPLIEYCLINNKNCYLPALENQHLNFIKYNENTKFKYNIYNIPEPIAKNKSYYIAAKDLDIVFVPLVAFNKSGQRLGMGGGFYDRTFDFLANSVNNYKNKPILIGIAYEFQYIDYIPNEPWDIKIHGVATEKEFIRF